MAERILTPRELNRALLARQLLLERSSLPLTRALEQIAGLQSQYAPSAYIALWSRLRDFRRDALTRALQQRRAVQGTLMRATIHIVSARDYPLFAAAIRNSRRDWWLKVHRQQLKGIDMNAVAARVRHHLARGPRRATELFELLRADGFPRIAGVSAGLWVDLIRVPPSGTWDQRRADLYGPTADWLSGTKANEDQGIKHLVRRYLSAFGPASVADIASWTGLAPSRLRSVTGRLPVRRFRDEHGGELLDLPRAPLPDPDTAAPVRFLPTWDATLLVHARRTQILPERFRSLVFNTKTPHSLCTFLVDGQVAGTWRYEERRIEVQPFGRISRVVRRKLDDEAERLAAFHAR